MTKALVLSGGGPVGIAWQTGLAAGLRRNGVDLSTADLVIGTSAGSAVGAQIALGRDMEAALARYHDALRRSGGAAPSVPAPPAGTASSPGSVAAPGAAMVQLMELMAKAADSDAAPEEVRAEIGRFALEAETGPEERFVDAFRHLAGETWPARYRCTAVDAQTGEFMVWDGSGGEALERAVASSCAVPGVFPPITINGRRYIDGGMRSGTNTDLAEGHERVLVVTLMAGNRMPNADPRMERYRARAEAEQAVVTAAGGEVKVVGPDDNTAGIIGINLMDPSVAPAAAQAGSLQGEALAGELTAWWS